MENKLTKKQDQELNFLDKASNDEICEYLKNLKSENRYNLQYHPKIKKVFTKIFNNKNKSVKIALIKYYPGYDGEKLAEKFLLESRNKEIRKECLNKETPFGTPLFYTIGGYNEKFIQFLKKASNEELYLYFTNKNIKLHNVRELFKRGEDKLSSFNKISDKLYRNIVLILEDNPNMHKEPDLFSDEYRSEYAPGQLWVEDNETFEKFHQDLKITKKIRNLE